MPRIVTELEHRIPRAEPAPRRLIEEVPVDRDTFGIRLMDTPEGRNSASMLVDKRYAWRGYAGTHTLEESPNRITLTATDQEQVVGTLTIGLDSPVGLLADAAYRDEIDDFRRRGARVCEFTKLAFEPGVRSKGALAALFHIAFLHARDLHGCTDLFIEVNPRHRRFYAGMLGFTPIGAPTISARVNAPAHLLWASFEHISEQIRQHGGTANREESLRSFYAWFFSPREEAGLIERLRKAELV